MASVNAGNRIECATGFSVGYFQRNLRRQRNQKGFFIFTEFTPGTLLHGDNPQHFTLMDNRGAKKGVVTFFLNFRIVLKAGVVGRILNIERLFSLPYQPDQAFRKANFNQLHGVGREAVGGF